MKCDVTIITPEIAAGSGGLADYTLRVVEHWPAPTKVRILSRGVSLHSEKGNLEIVELPCSEDAILVAMSASDGPVLLQYSAFGYNPDGRPDALINAVLHWKSSAPSRRLVVMFHEIWMFLPLWNRRFISQRQHRQAIGHLAQAADVVVTSTSSQATHLNNASGRSDVTSLPVGSNIQMGSKTGVARAAGVAIIFGLEQSRLRTLRKLHTELSALARANRITSIVTIGGKKGPEESVLLTRLKLANGFRQLGNCSEQMVADELAAASFGISDQDPLSYAKSGTLMAYAQHGLNIISPYAAARSEEPFSLLVAPDELLRGLSRDDLEDRAQRLRSWQARISSWQTIANFFRDALQLREPQRAAVLS